MNTPPRQASRSHHRPRREQTSSEVGEAQPGRDHEPMPETVQALVCDPWSHAGRVAAELARNRSEHSRLARLQVDERALEHAVVVAGPARRIAFGERARDIAAIPCERCCTDGVHAAMAGLARPGPVYLRHEVECDLRPLPVRNIAESLLEASLVTAARHLRVVRDEAPRHRMQRRRHSRRRSAVLADDGKRERRVGEHEDDEKADDRASARDPLSPEHPSNT